MATTMILAKALIGCFMWSLAGSFDCAAVEENAPGYLFASTLCRFAAMGFLVEPLKVVFG